MEGNMIGAEPSPKRSRSAGGGKPNFFVAIQVTNPKIHRAVRVVQNLVISKKPLFRSALIKLITLHITLCTLRLPRSDDIKRVKTALEKLEKDMKDTLIKNPVTLKFKGIGSFKNEVVFAKVEPGEPLTKVKNIHVDLMKALSDEGLIATDDFSPHLTIMKMSRDKSLRQKKMFWIPKYLYADQCDMEFGDQTVRSIQLLSIGDHEDDAYYNCYHNINLGSSDVEAEDHTDCCGVQSVVPTSIVELPTQEETKGESMEAETVDTVGDKVNCEEFSGRREKSPTPETKSVAEQSTKRSRSLSIGCEWPNFFVAIQVSNPEIHQGILDVQEHMISKNPAYKSGMVKLITLHMSLCSLHLPGNDDIRRVKSAMSKLEEKLKETQIKNLIHLKFKGIGAFNNEVVFAKVEPGEPLTRLESFHVDLMKALNDEGFMVVDDFSPRLAIMKMMRNRSMRKKKICTIPKGLYEDKQDMEFGEQIVRSIQLLGMKHRAENSYYKCYHSIDLGTKRHRTLVTGRTNPNFFVAIQVSNPEIHQVIQDVQKHIISKNPVYKSVMIKPITLHMTLCVLHLPGNDDIRRAKAALSKLEEKVKETVVENQINLKFKGMGSFNNEVVFAKVEPGEPLTRVESIHVDLMKALSDEGLTVVGDFSPHLTIMKMTMDFSLRRKKIFKIPKDLYEAKEDVEFGDQIVRSIQLLSMIGRPAASYYRCYHSIDLGSGDEENGDHTNCCGVHSVIPNGVIDLPPPEKIPGETTNAEAIETVAGKGVVVEESLSKAERSPSQEIKSGQKIECSSLFGSEGGETGLKEYKEVVTLGLGTSELDEGRAIVEDTQMEGGSGDVGSTQGKINFGTSRFRKLSVSDEKMDVEDKAN